MGPALALGLAALALLPGSAAAADPVRGCTQTNAADPATEPSTWTCFTDAATVSGYEVQRGGVSAPKPPVEGNITQMEVDVADGNGAVPIDRLMLHHIVFFNSGRRDPMCGGGERFYGAGEERLKLQLPPGYGYPISAGDSWNAVYMYMNHRSQTDRAWIKYSLTIDPRSGIRNVRSYWLDVGNCAFDPIYNVPGIERPQIPSCAKLK